LEFFKHFLGTVTDFALPFPILPISSEVSLSPTEKQGASALSWPMKYFKISPLSFPWFACNKWVLVLVKFNIGEF
jgi:hypothetical protein